MSKVFFLSHRKDSSADLIKSFYERLLDEVLSVLGERQDSSVGFFDAKGLRAGSQDYEASLHQALTDYPIGVVLLSPSYLSQNANFCCWEFMVFHKRNEEIVTAISGDPNKPTTLLIVNWEPLVQPAPRNYPLKVQLVRESISTSGLTTVENEAINRVFTAGLRLTLQLAKDNSDPHKQAVTHFTTALAKHVVKQWTDLGGDEWKKIGRWTLISDFNQTRQTWLPPRINSGEPPPPSKFRNKVFVVYVAANPECIPHDRQWRYNENGQEDWRPFGNSENLPPTIHESVTAAFLREGNTDVHRYGLEEFCTLVKDHKCRKFVEEWKCPIVILIDPWSVHQIEQYKKVLRKFTHVSHEDLALFAKPIVIWNEDDRDIAGIRAAFKKEMKDLFNGFYEETISPEFLGSRLIEAVQSLRSELRRVLKPRALQIAGARPPLLSNTEQI